MKQHITKEQWGELSDKQKTVYIQTITSFIPFFSSWTTNDDGLVKPTLDRLVNYPSIGQIIEFLGDDLIDISPPTKARRFWIVETKHVITQEKELADGLWIPVKEKIFVIQDEIK